MLIFLFLSQYRRRFSEVDADPVVLTERGPVEQLPDFDRGFDGGVGHYYAAEGAEGGEGVKGCGRAQEVVDALEVLGQEGCEGVEVLRSRGLAGVGKGWLEAINLL